MQWRARYEARCKRSALHLVRAFNSRTRVANALNDVAGHVNDVASTTYMVRAWPRRPRASLNEADDAAGYHDGRRRGLTHRLIRRQRLLHRPVSRDRWVVLATSKDAV